MSRCLIVGKMKFKYLIASLILAILMVSAVSVDDTVSQDVISGNDDNALETIEDEVYTKSTGTSMLSAVSADDMVSQDVTPDNGDDTLETIGDEIYTGTESTGTFTDLNYEIYHSTGNVLNITCNYKFNNETDTPNSGIFIGKENFVINGNGHTIDADNQSGIFIFKMQEYRDFF